MKILITPQQDIYGMARIGWVDPTGDKGIEVYVHTNDGGRTAHFHVRKYGGHGQFEWECCIEYKSAKYFKHGKYQDELPDRKTAKQLDKMLRSVNKSSRFGTTYWQDAIDEWNRNNSVDILPLDLEQPDYSKIVSDD